MLSYSRLLFSFITILLFFALWSGGCVFHGYRSGSDEQIKQDNGLEINQQRDIYFFEVYVRVLDAGTSLPISGARVTAFQNTGGIDYRTEAGTDKDGFAVFRIYESSRRQYHKEKVIFEVNHACYSFFSRSVILTREKEVCTFYLGPRVSR